MTDRLTGKKAVVVGAGQQPGETIGNGRAMSILFAREGAEVLCVDRDLERAQETVAMINAEGGQASAFQVQLPLARPGMKMSGGPWPSIRSTSSAPLL